MSDSTKPTVLKIKGEQYVTVRRQNHDMYLCAVHFQDIKDDVHIENRRVKDIKQMAFEFNYTNNKYLVKVENEKLMVEKKTDCNSLTDKHWFERVDLKSGTYYGLRSVAEPSQYLSKCVKGKRTILCLRPNEDECAHLRDE